MWGKTKISLLLGLAVLSGIIVSCDREPGRMYAGEFTIDNVLFGYGPYYAIGFSFELGTELKTSDSPPPDITVHAKTDAQGNVSGAYLDTPNVAESYALAGDFNTATEAKDFFDNLLQVGTYTWTLFADNISEHQVYVFKTREDNYVKFRIKNLVLDNRDDSAYAEVTIEWRIQPDGSTTFSQ
ncbi:MAG: hypothetical protein JW965_10090 [Bacteroidales bacterium]|nr:hypothetical protein [Bacteroidales bacterium]